MSSRQREDVKLKIIQEEDIQDDERSEHASDTGDEGSTSDGGQDQATSLSSASDSERDTLQNPKKNNGLNTTL